MSSSQSPFAPARRIEDNEDKGEHEKETVTNTEPAPRKTMTIQKPEMRLRGGCVVRYSRDDPIPTTYAYSRALGGTFRCLSLLRRM